MDFEFAIKTFTLILKILLNSHNNLNYLTDLCDNVSLTDIRSSHRNHHSAIFKYDLALSSIDRHHPLHADSASQRICKIKSKSAKVCKDKTIVSVSSKPHRKLEKVRQ